jgi:SAM-dependent methyltransferase
MTPLDRVVELLDPVPAEPDVSRGHLDLLGELAQPHDTIAQRFMRSGALPKIYEHVWRPVLFGLSKGGPFGPGTAEEYALARDWLGLDETPGATVLDVACGPGNVTRALATGVTGDGLVVGIDASATMLDRAVADTAERGGSGSADIGYVRGDAVHLPFREGVFDAVCCFGGLYLFDDPWTAIDGMARVLRPGGRIVLLTTRRPPLPLIGDGAATVSRLAGIRMFGSAEISEALAVAGFTAVRRRSYGLMQFAGGTLA